MEGVKCKVYDMKVRVVSFAACDVKIQEKNTRYKVSYREKNCLLNLGKDKLRRRRWEKRSGRARERKVSDEDIRFDNFG